ncbi:MAG: heavy-metal-associated domain-containing protein [Clostridium sp.]|nr:heavy-metal-associated domain-containing protein [Clostridium sp.]
MKKVLSIQGMSCKHCVMHVTEALEGAGAKDVKVSLLMKSAKLEAGEDVTDEKLKKVVEDAGYSVTKIKNK